MRRKAVTVGLGQVSYWPNRGASSRVIVTIKRHERQQQAAHERALASSTADASRAVLSSGPKRKRHCRGILIATCELKIPRGYAARPFQSPCDDAERGASLYRRSL